MNSLAQGLRLQKAAAIWFLLVFVLKAFAIPLNPALFLGISGILFAVWLIGVAICLRGLSGPPRMWAVVLAVTSLALPVAAGLGNIAAGIVGLIGVPIGQYQLLKQLCRQFSLEKTAQSLQVVTCLGVTAAWQTVDPNANFFTILLIPVFCALFVHALEEIALGSKAELR